MKKLKILLITVILTFTTVITVFAEDAEKIGNIGNEAGAFIDDMKSDFIILVNKKNLLPESYVPDQLVNIAETVSSTKKEIYLQQEAASQYIRMVQAMEAEGIKLAAVSGYRTYKYQSNLYINKVNYYKKYYADEEARVRAGQVVAPPGASEHQTGLAIDVSVSSIGYALDGRFQNTKAYKWLKDNSYKYGFIIRYPQEKREITDIIFEPWHLRYVGEHHAEEVFLRDICLEEYIESIDNNQLQDSIK